MVGQGIALSLCALSTLKTASSRPICSIFVWMVFVNREPVADSGRSVAVIPFEVGQGFRLKWGGIPVGSGAFSGHNGIVPHCHRNRAPVAGIGSEYKMALVIQGTMFPFGKKENMCQKRDYPCAKYERSYAYTLKAN